MQTVAGAQQQFYQFAKIQSACLFPLKMPSLKNPDPGSLCKKWGVRVSHVEKPPVFAKIKRFLRQPGLLHFLVEIPRVLKMLCSSIKQISPIEGCQTPTLSWRSPIKPIKTDLGGSQARQV